MKSIPMLILLNCSLLFCQVNAQNRSSFNILFYNVENLFDTINDPLKNDDEFLPNGSKQWTLEKYHQKLLEVSKVIIAAGGWNPPVIVGLAEVENEKVLEDLTHLTPLEKLGYSFEHFESGDRRGIDVAFLYRKEWVEIINAKPIPIKAVPTTRDILLVVGKIHDDTCHFFVNHWPSRISGKEFTENLRMATSKALIESIDSISSIVKSPKFIVMGDFNDEPDDYSLKQIFEFEFRDKTDREIKFIGTPKIEGRGTTVYTDAFKNWYLFDQILISNNIAVISKPHPVSLPWILNFKGDPNRTFLGDYYNGGVSDHLPVKAEISFTSQ